MTEESGAHRGSCLCGAVRYEVRGKFERFFLCHCSRCRKSSGTAHASNLFAPGAELTWLAGEDLIRSYAVEGTRFSRSFCGTCGSMLPQAAANGVVKVPAGSLDTPLAMRPLGHIFMGSRADWDHDLENVPGFDERPG